MTFAQSPSQPIITLAALNISPRAANVVCTLSFSLSLLRNIFGLTRKGKYPHHARLYNNMHVVWCHTSQCPSQYSLIRDNAIPLDSMKMCINTNTQPLDQKHIPIFFYIYLLFMKSIRKSYLQRHVITRIISVARECATFEC